MYRLHERLHHLIRRELTTGRHDLVDEEEAHVNGCHHLHLCVYADVGAQQALVAEQFQVDLRGVQPHRYELLSCAGAHQVTQRFGIAL